MRGSAGPVASPEEAHRDGRSRRRSGLECVRPTAARLPRGPAVKDRDLDAEFARIIAGWEDEAPDPQARARAPAAPDDAPPSSEPADPAAPIAPADSVRTTGT